MQTGLHLCCSHTIKSGFLTSRPPNHILSHKHTVHVLFQKSKTSFEKSVDPDQLASYQHCENLSIMKH